MIIIIIILQPCYRRTIWFQKKHVAFLKITIKFYGEKYFNKLQNLFLL